MFNLAVVQALIRSTTSRYRRILKWDRNQPRGAKGTREGGRWVKDVSQGTGTASPTFKPPEYGFGSTENLRMAAARAASYADILNAPTGTGFGNAPRLTGDPEMVQRLTPAPPPKTNKVLKVLKTAQIADAEEIGPGEHTNDVFKVTLDDADGTEAALKSEKGETWTGSFSNGDINDYVTNRDFSLAEREAVAYEFSEAVGLHIVPETVHRHELENLPEGGGSGGSGYDDDELQQMYDEYKEKNQERVMEAVGEDMSNLYHEAQTEHVADIERRVDEVQEIWDDLTEDLPDRVELRAQQAVDREHPNLPLGSQPGFHQKTVIEDSGAFDPLELLDEAEVDVTARLSEVEKKKIRDVLQKRWDEGYSDVGALDEDAAREHLQYDKFIEDHADTEGRLYEEKFQSFDSWKQSQGYESGGGSGGIKNTQAPHPNGGVLQTWVPGLKNWGHTTPEEERKLAIFDYAVGTMDRHGSNMFFDGDGKMLAMDNGYTFPDAKQFTFRTDKVRDWRSNGTNTIMPEAERKQLAQVFQDTDWKAFVDRHPSMSSGEREAFLGRINDLKAALRTGTGLYLLWKRQDIMW